MKISTMATRHAGGIGRRYCQTFYTQRVVIVAAVMVLIGVSHGVSAQSQMTLSVVCRTVADAPLADIVVTVYDAQRDVTLAAATTQADGTVRFAGLPTQPVRVAVAGTLPDGTALRHTRQDGRGIWVNLPARDWRMTLRVDTDGLVFPDLGVADAGAPDAEAATAISEAVLRTAVPASSTALPRSVDVMSTSTPFSALPPHTAMQDRSGLLVLLMLVATIGLVAWLIVRSRA